MAFVTVKAGRLYYETAGDGAPLVLIHPGFLDSRMWDDQFRILARRNMVVRYDVRGYGRSSRPRAQYSDADDLLALVDHLGLKKACILGMSNGGRIALDFITAHPERVSGLILASPGIRGYKTSGPAEDKVWDDQDARESLQSQAAKEGRIADAVKMDLEIWAPAQDVKNRRRLHKIASDNSHIHNNHPNKFQRSPEPPAFERLAFLRAPVTLIVGDRDVEGMKILVRTLHGLIPHSGYHEIRGADHIANMSRPKEFNAIVATSLKGIQANARDLDS